MALIKCPDCKRDVSDKATACPHCGFLISELGFEQAIRGDAGDNPPQTPPRPDAGKPKREPHETSVPASPAPSMGRVDQPKDPDSSVSASSRPPAAPTARIERPHSPDRNRMGRRNVWLYSLALAGLVAVLFIVLQEDDQPSPPAPAMLAADTELVRELLAGWSDASVEGPESNASYMSLHNYPGMGYSARECVPLATIFRGPYQVDDASIHRDDDFTLPFGAVTRFEGRVYAMEMFYTLPNDSRQQGHNHVVILDGTAYLIVRCEGATDE